jgi:hypothetical protein
MSETERARRHEPLYKVVTTHTSHTWAAVLVKMLLGQINRQNTARQTPFIPKEKLADHYRNTTNRLMLFDYDVSQGVPTGGHSQLTGCLTTGNPYTHREDAQYGGALGRGPQSNCEADQ